MPRQQVAMTAAETAAFLARKRVAIVGSIAPDGAPDGEPARLAYADGAVTVSVPRDGPTERNLRHDPRLVCSVEEFPSYEGIKGVTVHGTAVGAGDDAGQARYRIDRPRLETFDFAKMRR